MAITEHELELAERRTQALRQQGHATAARYDRRRSRVVISLNTGVEVTFPAGLAECLTDATSDDLADVEITPSGLVLHWPRLDADLYVPALLAGVFGTERWMASQLGAKGGRARSAVKAASSRRNGRKGGRPRKQGNA
ncbi:MAG: DUF2442 domain-containing protein [Gammaproteobacteria bacterium]|nr:DUF2442 domain-containing protein [Gammaproteobacteria bacterium]